MTPFNKASRASRAYKVSKTMGQEDYSEGIRGSVVEGLRLAFSGGVGRIVRRLMLSDSLNAAPTVLRPTF